MAASDQGDKPDTALPPAGVQPGATERQGWIEVLGLEFTRVSAELVSAEWNVQPKHLQPHGIVHGGVYASVVETCCSVGAMLAAPEGKQVVGVENNTSFIRQARQGRLHARATPIHAGRRAQLWECNITDAGERLIATGRLRVMCIEAEPER
jgi:1,4-dihydroxy-2-naphthoyl-CoA hydrolase